MHTGDNSNNSKIHFLLIPIYMKNFAINILSLLLIASVFISCGKIPDGIVESKLVDYKVVAISAPTTFSTNSSDSVITTSVWLQRTATISIVWCSVISNDGSETKYSRVNLLDNGDLQNNGDQKKDDGIYSGKFIMSKKYSNGKYQIEYFVEDNVRTSPDNVKKVGTSIFSYDNGQTNFAPVLSNLIIPETVNRGEAFIFTIKVDDQNGLSDIAQVYFKLVRPDDTTVTPGPQDDNGSGFFLMHDDGNTNYGDVQAGDGIYSFKNSFGSTSQTGQWKFEFRAKDKGTPSKLSNVITINLAVN
ncbi:MAG: hypothetical protein D4R68_08970 [Ignavibacteriales bacterium]|nr:MAG: hypothetical protein D4R68_08970 [Ignavibacteriales bacterium]